MIAPSSPDERSPGPSGPARSSPTEGSCNRADRASADSLLSCHAISSPAASGRSGLASATALAAYAAAPRRAHMRHGSALPGGSRGSRCSLSACLACCLAALETPSDLAGDVKFAPGKRPGPCDGVSGTAVIRGLGFEDSEHSLRAVRCPGGDDPTFSLAERLRRRHAQSLPSPTIASIKLAAQRRTIALATRCSSSPHGQRRPSRGVASVSGRHHVPDQVGRWRGCVCSRWHRQGGVARLPRSEPLDQPHEGRDPTS